MLIKVKKQKFDLLKCSDLSQKCFEPIIKIYKNKVSEETNFSTSRIKEQFYQQLTEGQRALFMFYVYHNHVSKSINEFYWWNAYFMAQPKSWSALKAGIKYFSDESMLLLLEKVELELKKHNLPNSLDNFTITREDLNQNKELHTSIHSLHVIFENTSPLTIIKINDYIENNLQDFLIIED